MHVKFIAMGCGPAKGNLKRSVKFAERSVCRHEQSTPDWRVGDISWAQLNSHNVIGSFAVLLMRGPVFGLVVLQRAQEDRGVSVLLQTTHSVDATISSFERRVQEAVPEVIVYTSRMVSQELSPIATGKINYDRQ